MKAQIVLFDGFDELDAIGPYEVLRTAAVAGADLTVELATLHPTEEILAGHGLRVRPQARLAEGGLDLLIVPGGGWIDRTPKGLRAEVGRGELPAAVARLHRGGATAASVCTGAMLLAAAGLTAGRPAITHHAAVEDLRASGAVITEARVVDDGDLITAGGVTSGLDLALWVVERWFGAERARAVGRWLEQERRGPVWRRP
jgi:transcriptional regulator GlxA family with amidase domain